MSRLTRLRQHQAAEWTRVGGSTAQSADRLPLKKELGGHHENEVEHYRIRVRRLAVVGA
jgi:hypothetical protein